MTGIPHKIRMLISNARIMSATQRFGSQTTELLQAHMETPSESFGKMIPVSWEPKEPSGTVEYDFRKVTSFDGIFYYF